MAPHATANSPTFTERSPQSQSICALIETHAREQPHSIAVSQEDRSLTYEQLHKASLFLAALFDTNGVKAEDSIPIFLSRSLESVASILALMRLGACFVPMDASAWSQARVDVVLGTIEPKTVVASDRSELNAAGHPMIDADDVRSAFKDSMSEKEVPTMNGELDTPGDPEHPVYIIFTSGTTGKPKGVVIPRRCVENYVMQGRDQGMPFNLGVASEDKVLLLFSLAFDAAWGVFFSCLCHGGHLVLSEPARVLEDAKDCTILPATPSLLTTLGDPAAYVRVKSIFLGGESPSPALIERWSTPKRQIFNCYGPTETTICASMARLQPGKPITLGDAMNSTRMLILDENLKESDEGEIGITGPGLASGYYKNEALTAERFITWNGCRVYRTLDRARKTPEGIVFCGREDGMVKNRGFLINIEMDVLPIITSYPEVHSAAALMHEGKLMAAVMPEGLDITEMRLQLSTSHDEFVVPDQIVALSELPRTSNGKVDLKKLRKTFKTMFAKTVSKNQGATRLEILQEAIADALGRPVASVNTHCSFWELGGNSLLAIKLLSILSQSGYRVSFKEVFAPISLALLSERLEPVGIPAVAPLACSIEIDQRDSLIKSPITATQLGMIRSSIKDSTASYMLVTIGHPWSSEAGHSDKVRDAWKAVLEQHTIFRTTFDVIEGIQEVSPEYRHDWETRCVTNEDLPAALRDESDELMKLTGHNKDSNVFHPLSIFRLVVNESHTDANLLWLVHHSLVDGWSMSLIVKQVQALLDGKTSMSEPAQFWQFSQSLSQQSQITRAKALDFWKEALSKVADAVPLSLPIPKDPTDERQFGITTVNVELAVTQIEQVCRIQNVTSATMIHAAWALLLRSYTAQEQVTFGTIFSGRDFPLQGIDTLVGPTLNTCPFPMNLVDFKSKKVFLSSVQRLLLDIGSHQWSAQEALQSIMPGSHSRVYQTTLFLEYDLPIFEDSTLKFSRTDFPEFGLTVIIRREGYQLTFQGLFDQTMYTRPVVQRMMTHFRNIFIALLDPQCQTISQVRGRMLEPIEVLSLTTNSPTLMKPYTGPSNLKDSFEAGVDQWPDAVAIESKSCSITYRELDQLANHVAKTIADRLCPGDAVGIISDRSIEWLISVIAVIKAGAIYVPLDKKLPVERMRIMIHTAQVKLCVFPNEDCHSEFQDISKEDVLLQRMLQKNESKMVSRLKTITVGEDIAYITFTSGSTGVPKGVRIPHQAVVSYLAYGPARMDARPGRRHSQMFSPGFDVSQAEIFGTLFHATMITPSFLSVLDPSDLPNIDTILFAGEAVPQILADRWAGTRTVYNSYGPCECTIGCLFQPLDPHKEVTLGRTIPRVGVYLLDSQKRPVPIGVPGEICLSGIQIANGYIGAGMESVSRTRFIPDPFVPGYRMYRTGDCAVWTEDMEPKFLGRYDNQVKIRGYRVELNEVENAIRSVCPNVRRAAALVSNDNILAFVEPEDVDIDGLQNALQAKLPRYACPSNIMAFATLPTMPNQKLDRKALQSYLDVTKKQNQTRLTPLQSLVAQVWREAIGLPETVEIGETTDFLALGGNSLSQIKAAQAASRRLNKKLPMGLFIWNTILSALCEEIAGHLPDESGLSDHLSFASSWKTVKPPYTNVYDIEKEAFQLSVSSPTPHAFNVACHLRLKGDLNLKVFERAIARVTSCEPVLKTCFRVDDGQLLRNQSDVPCELRVEKLSEPSVNIFANRPFDLSSGPLTRIMINDNISWLDLVIVQHHAITDKAAMRQLLQKVQKEYLRVLEGGSETTKIAPAQVPDYTIWAQWQRLNQPSLVTQNEHAEYWRAQLLDLPTPPFQPLGQVPRAYVGHSQSILLDIPPACTGSMEFYVALVGKTLAKVQKSQDVIIGIPHIDRTEPGTEDLLGCFLDRLPVRVKILSEDLDDFEGLIKTAQTSIKNSLKHSISLKDIRKIVGQEEIFQVMVVYNRKEDSIENSITLPNIEIEPGHVKTTGAKFPLLIEFTEEEGYTTCDFEYMEDIVPSETVSVIAQKMREILSAV
ncbi:uncharacterized protein N7477_007563 [Penicillium maclennaniae]|uniref:uncharacterized protein n=1 Tax=Penicillium maclennaniae TaxID=1343394 RepID=UPI00253FFC42|nr:uncharacterized protein N7477_007563 [Penicillium maclennaniae]KAJ5665115.1 hypothetical protein N7477_007563 [Penicillium maclennaniae]